MEVRRRGGKKIVAGRALPELGLFFSPVLNVLNFYQLQIAFMSQRYKRVLIF